MIAVAKAQAGAKAVRDVIESGDAVMSWINLGEVFYVLARELGEPCAQQVVDHAVLDVSAEVPSGGLVLEAARIKAGGGLSYADAFAVATARRHRAPLYTGDPEILAAADDVETVDLRAKA